MQETPVLIFVYNADSGALNAVKDSLHKWLSPDTYECNLCALTHGTLGEKQDWIAFKNEFPTAMEFYHKDQFTRKFKSKWLPKYDFPLVLLARGSALDPFITAETLNAITTLNLLKQELLTAAKVFELN